MLGVGAKQLQDTRTTPICKRTAYYVLENYNDEFSFVQASLAMLQQINLIAIQPWSDFRKAEYEYMQAASHLITNTSEVGLWPAVEHICQVEEITTRRQESERARCARRVKKVVA